MNFYGKTTQLNYFENYLSEIGVNYVRTREPGGSNGAEEIRSLIVKGEISRWSPETETLLFFASRRDHMEKTIIPALEAGKVVICDRFTDSTRVYQGLARSEIVRKVDTLQKIMIKLEPDLTFILDMDPGLALKRGLARKSGEDRFENFGKDFQERARKGFLELSKKFPYRCKIIHADRNPNDISTEIIKQFRHLVSTKS